MSKLLRCSRCFAPKEHPDEICEFCGLDPMEEIPIVEFSKGLFNSKLDDEPLPDGLSLDEKILRLREKKRK